MIYALLIVPGRRVFCGGRPESDARGRPPGTCAARLAHPAKLRPDRHPTWRRAWLERKEYATGAILSRQSRRRDHAIGATHRLAHRRRRQTGVAVLRGPAVVDLLPERRPYLQRFLAIDRPIASAARVSGKRAERFESDAGPLHPSSTDPRRANPGHVLRFPRHHGSSLRSRAGHTRRCAWSSFPWSAPWPPRWRL